MINLLVNTREESKTLLQLKHLAKVLTTVVLCIYIIASGAFLGFTFFQANKTVRVSNELTQLTDQVNAKATEEVLVRKISTKAAEVNSFVQNRPTIVDFVDTLVQAPYTTNKWLFSLNGNIQIFEVPISAPSQVQTYVDYLKTKYSNVKLEKIEYGKDLSWTGKISVSGQLVK